MLRTSTPHIPQAAKETHGPDPVPQFEPPGVLVKLRRRLPLVPSPANVPKHIHEAVILTAPDRPARLAEKSLDEKSPPVLEMVDPLRRRQIDPVLVPYDEIGKITPSDVRPSKNFVPNLGQKLTPGRLNLEIFPVDDENQLHAPILRPT